MAPVVKLVPRPPEPKPVPQPVADLDAFGTELLERIGTTTQPYRVYAALVNFSLRFFQLHAATPKRERPRLIGVFLRHGQAIYARWLSLQRVQMSKPPKPEAGLPPVPEEAQKPKTTFEVLSELYQSL